MWERRLLLVYPMLVYPMRLVREEKPWAIELGTTVFEESPVLAIGYPGRMGVAPRIPAAHAAGLGGRGELRPT